MSLGIFSVSPPTEPCALRSTQPLKVGTRDFSWGKGGRCVWLTTYHPCSAETSRKSRALIYPEPLGPPRPVARHLFFTLWSFEDAYGVGQKISWTKNFVLSFNATNETFLYSILEMWCTFLQLPIHFHYIGAAVPNIEMTLIMPLFCLYLYASLYIFFRSVGPPSLHSAVLPPPPGRHASGGHERAPGGGARLQHIRLHSHRGQLVPLGRADPVLASELATSTHPNKNYNRFTKNLVWN